MLKATAQITFSDGEVVTVIVVSRSPQSRGPVKYTGAATRLPRVPNELFVEGVVSYCRAVALETGATYTVEFDGEYEVWAE